MILVLALAACFTREPPVPGDLRGWWEPSADGATRLVVDDDDGSADNRFCVAGVAHPAHVAFTVKPGTVEIGLCQSAPLGVIVRPGTTYHLNYWGP